MSEMVAVQYTCITSLNNTDFYVFSYSATGKKTERVLENSLVTLICCNFFFYQSVQELN